MDHRIEIPLSKFKLTSLLLISILFVVLSAAFMILPYSIDYLFIGKKVFVFAVGVVGLVFFGICSFFLGRKLADKTPGLIISAKGIVDNASACAAGFVPWSDIIAINKLEVTGQKFLMLIVTNPEEYITRHKSVLIKKTAKMNHQLYGSPISISANGLKYNFDELQRVIQNEFEKHRK